jgi:hypothetical protein
MPARDRDTRVPERTGRATGDPVRTRRTKQGDAARAVALTYSEYLKAVEAADAATIKHQEAQNRATKLGLPEAGFQRAGIKRIDGPAALMMNVLVIDR